MEVTVQEAKTHLSRLLRRVEAGETVVIRRGRTRVAVLGPAPVITERRNIWGDLDGELTSEFDEPLDDFEPYVS
ncbi:type II toxin-antitoxin system Phd/YefM family antitoxin [Ornithinimicrobium faecis]|uniref:Type II toxin-antitoxin system prevent-host-death family antitoxin n=1 Tax=Ornithinimicrobium faecis TaxID=2934158 RepID=A0ABY4YP85_9MICO|nr:MULTISPECIES: type II toxin-antitoxin system prevent-host-death family antitoxin [unclassified Ornithinimicrobium]USQ78424.1 type II toxin-antitoxin system prevent-host-death family antitoxin [Ornithinimicrobium sp. HY1793]